jgi:NADPH:quinone reductase-like Zn-dependent oxidoreductase
MIPFRSSAVDNLRLKCGEIAGDPPMRAYEILAGSSTLDGLRRCERPDPKPLPGQILVRIEAASLNYRDLLIARGHYMGGTVGTNTIALSDGAGEAVAVGAAVTRFRVGERVAGTFFRGWIDGKPPRGPLHGGYVGCRGHFERMNTAIAAHRMEPIIDREFGFEDAPAAYRHLESGAHFGKVVIRL